MIVPLNSFTLLFKIKYRILKTLYLKLIERHIITRKHKNYKFLDSMCFKSKNLYNSALYIIKQEFINNGRWIRYNELNKILKETNQFDYRAITNNSAQQILMLLDSNLKSYFQSIKSWKRDNKKFLGCPQFPKYKNKETGRNIFVYTYVQLGYKYNHITFPKLECLLPLKTKIPKEQIKQVRIIPQTSCYIIEVVYEIQEIIKENKNNNWLAIDLGLNNLATCISNNIKNGFIINGKPLKSINQYYNKKKAKLQSQLKKNHNKFISKRIGKLTLKRNNKINDYLHKTSKKIIDKCLENNINNIVIGKNDGWKQEVSIGKRNNQNFVQIPFENFIQKIAYKAKLKGLEVNIINESYTSKCSSLDLESIEKHEQYLGKRIRRGLFKTYEGKLINADVNGALNILRKQVADDVLMEPICRGLAHNPIKINLY